MYNFLLSIYLFRLVIFGMFNILQFDLLPLERRKKKYKKKNILRFAWSFPWRPFAHTYEDSQKITRQKRKLTPSVNQMRCIWKFFYRFFVLIEESAWRWWIVKGSFNRSHTHSMFKIECSHFNETNPLGMFADFHQLNVMNRINVVTIKLKIYFLCLLGADLRAKVT